jgi:F-type H+-transporting ATPase subunit b
MLEFDGVTLLLQILNFVALLYILNLLVFKPLRKRMDERGKTISDSLQSAQDTEAEANRLKAEWEATMRELEEQREDYIHRAQAEASQRRAQILEDARVRLDKLTEEAREAIARQRGELVVQHYDEIVDTILTLSGSVVQSVTTRRTHDDLVNNFCASIYQMPPNEVDQYRQAMAGRLPMAFVVTPTPLSADQTKTVSDTLSSLVDHRVELQVTVDPRLIAGIQVRLADKLIDNSIRQQLERLRERVLADLVARTGPGK